MRAAPFPCIALGALLGLGAVHAGPYSAGVADSVKADAAIPGFTGPHGDGAARLQTGPNTFINDGNYVNPLFFGWADSIENYAPTAEVAGPWQTPLLTRGPVTGDLFDICSLGDLAAGGTPGSLTLYFTEPIRDLSGADFAVFENGFYSFGGGVLAELAYVEVSTDGFTYTRFPATSLTPAPVGDYGTIDPTNVRNLAGKHINAGGASWGTPFDLADLGLDGIHFIRLIDIPGTGAFLDSTGQPIYDAWLTTGSGGADIEAVGVISQLTTFATWPSLHALSGDDLLPDADPDADGLPNLLEYAFTRLPDLTDASSAPVAVENPADRLELIFTRDERATDLTYEVQARDGLSSGQWTTIAKSESGQPFAGADGFTPGITETRASPIASIGVIRKVRIADVQTLTGHPCRFLRVKVTQASP